MATVTVELKPHGLHLSLAAPPPSLCQLILTPA